MTQSFSVRITKRFFDMAGASIGIGLTLPLYPLIATAIYVDSPGPIFYQQRRAGRVFDRNERANQSGGPVRNEESLRHQLHFTEFTIVKFRTMCTDAEKLTGAVLAEQNDPRITRVGRFLRKTRLDELPQLWNVLRGDMSLIGPRPERPELLENLALAIPFFEERMHNVKPGLTGLAQVSLGYTGRPDQTSELAQFLDSLTNPFKLTETEGALADDMRIKLLYDLAYVAGLEKFSTFLRMELTILLRTPLVMLRGSGR